jgi:hypothetical protein
MIQSKDFGFKETSLMYKRDVLDISLESGVMSSFTAFVAINKELNEPIQGPLVHRDIPRPILLGAGPNRPSDGGKFYPVNTFMNMELLLLQNGI